MNPYENLYRALEKEAVLSPILMQRALATAKAKLEDQGQKSGIVRKALNRPIVQQRENLPK